MCATVSRDLDLLALGLPPEDPKLLDQLTIGQSVWEGFAVREYLEGYIADGGSQFKLIVGKPGSGKTHLLRRFERAARERGYLVAAFPANAVRLQRIDDLYRAIVDHVDLEGLVRALAHRVIKAMGYTPEEIPDSQTFAEWLIEDRSRMPEMIKREVREHLEGFFKSREVNTSLCSAFIQLSYSYLGLGPLASEEVHIIYQWLCGEQLRVAQLRPVSIPRAIDRYNARDMLDSLSRLARELGFKGLVVLIDGLEDLCARNPETKRWKYTPKVRSDVYQSLRQFIDALPTLTSVLFVLAGRRDPLLDDPARGVKSYDALWLRLQQEIAVQGMFNRFGQVVDLDQGVAQLVTLDEWVELYRRVRVQFGGEGPVDRSVIEHVLNATGELGQFRRIVQAARP